MKMFLAAAWGYLYLLQFSWASPPVPLLRNRPLTDAESFRRDGTQSCTPETVSVRREWGTLSRDERLDYIRSVKCLMDQPSIIPPGLVPGSSSLWHDFIGEHINKTLQIHGSGLFFAWHRHYIYTWETLLQDKCGYKGALPYWNWPLWASNLSASPIFDGSDTSLSGDGEYDPHQLAPIDSKGNPLPVGTGGGCVTTGPFANLTLPFTVFPLGSQFDMNGTLPENALDAQPHCFKRSLNSKIASTYCGQESVDFLMERENIFDFQKFIDVGLEKHKDHPMGPHGGGHRSAGPALFDFFGSPGDPSFFLLHSFLDLLWSTWQARDPCTRLTAVYGTMTLADRPPSDNVTLDTVLDFGYLTESRRIGELMSITEGPYCYRYEHTSRVPGEDGPLGSIIDWSVEGS